MSHTLFIAIQLIVAFGLLNVWLVRANMSTNYRGGNARTIKEEFAVYGLPGWFCTVIGVLKVGAAIALLIGLWVPALVFPASALIVGLMLGAVSMHAKVKDPIVKTVPAAAMLIMSVILVSVSVGS